MYSDYHVRSFFSFDSKENPENIIEKAISLQMKQICFTDHQDFNWPVVGENPQIDFERYNTTISLLKETYKSQIENLKGIELGLTTDTLSECRSLLAREKFDFVIGSMHVVDNMDSYYQDFWGCHTDRDAVEKYFSNILKCLKSFTNISTLGHLDYIVRCCPNKDANYSVSDYQDMIDEILKIIIEKNICLEINTASLSRGLSFTMPHPDILKRYKELGGTYVTVGSDAHCVKDLGRYFDTAKDIIEKYGFDVCTV